jgi:hypothetical protein
MMNADQAEPLFNRDKGDAGDYTLQAKIRGFLVFKPKIESL